MRIPCYTYWRPERNSGRSMKRILLRTWAPFARSIGASWAYITPSRLAVRRQLEAVMLSSITSGFSSRLFLTPRRRKALAGVVAAATLPVFSGAAIAAFTLQDLGVVSSSPSLLGGINGGINNAGSVVGELDASDGSSSQGFVYKTGSRPHGVRNAGWFDRNGHGDQLGGCGGRISGRRFQ